MGISTVGTKLKFDTHEIGCMFGDFDIEKNREVKEKKCLISGTVKKALGIKKISDITLTIPKGEASNADAEAAIRAAFESGDLLAFELEDSDIITAGTGNGSKVSFNCYVVSDVVSYKEDDDLDFKFTITVDGDYTLTPAA